MPWLGFFNEKRAIQNALRDLVSVCFFLVPTKISKNVWDEPNWVPNEFVIVVSIYPAPLITRNEIAFERQSFDLPNVVRVDVIDRIAQALR